MATINDFGDELPADNKTAGSIGHVEDHNRLSRELAEVQDVVKQLVNSGVGVKGYVSQEDLLPASGSPGDMYFVGPDGDIFGWNPTTSQWELFLNLQGPQGIPGNSGTVVGILDAHDATPPVGTLPGTLWWVPNEGETVPSPDTAPIFVGSYGATSTTNSATIDMGAIAGIQSGDVAVCAVIVNSGTAPTISQAGWTEVTSVARSTSPCVKVWTKVLSGTDSNFTVGVGTATKHAAGIMVFRNVTLASGLPKTQAISTIGASATGAAAQVTPVDPSIVCGFWMERIGTGHGVFTVAAPTDWTDGDTGGLSTLTGGGVCSLAMGYDTASEEDAARPAAPGADWIASVTPSSDTYSVTVALEAV